MIRGVCLLFCLIFLSSYPYSTAEDNQMLDVKVSKDLLLSPTELLYKSIGLEGLLDYSLFERAYEGLKSQTTKNKNILTIIDFRLPSTEKRLYTIDLKNRKLLFHSLVSHGRNSGEKYARSFSNRHGSFQSSLGFYVTENTYYGSNGFSLRLEGLEKGINDQAKPRAIVIHGADYASNQVISSTGRLGRSYGCPALPREINRPLINTIKDGTLLYIHADDPHYFANTKVNMQSPILLASKGEDRDAEYPIL